ncbi:MAG: hypothetical protein HQL45_14255 [Alphaproteobacteria bacterium]|nr:hypothetical protein [Alphaproteobacteria bacterium]
MSHIGPISQAEWNKMRGESLTQGILTSKIEDILLGYQGGLLSTTAINQVTVVEKSRRTGMTWAAAADAVLTSASSRTAGGMDTLYIGYNLDMAREFIDTCAMWAKAFSSAVASVEEFLFKDDKEDEAIQAFRIRFDSGFEITALSSRPRSLRGRQGYVIIDEAAFHDDLPELLKAALALLIWGGKVLIISTHDGDGNAFNQLVEDIRKGRKPYALISLDFDQALHDGLYQRICQRQGKTWSPEAEAKWREEIVAFYGDAADEELYLIPTKGSGAYLPAHLLDRAMTDIPVIRKTFDPNFVMMSETVRQAEIERFCNDVLLPLLTTLSPSLPSYLGYDIARNGDLSGFWPGQIGRDMAEIIPFILELRNAPFGAQRQILWFILKHLPRFTKARIDATGLGAQLAEEAAQEFGFERIDQVKIGSGWYETEMPLFKRFFEDGFARLSKDLDVYNDHRAVKMVRGKPYIERSDDANERKVDGAKGRQSRHGDTAIAHVLFVGASKFQFVDMSHARSSGQARSSTQAMSDDGQQMFGRERRTRRTNYSGISQ